MNNAQPHPPLPRNVIRLAARLHRRHNAALVMLFGSYARGKNTERSDIDLLVVAPSVAEAEELVRRRQQLTAGQFPRIDLVISSREELTQARGERAAFLRSVLEHGIVLFGEIDNTKPSLFEKSSVYSETL